MTKKQIYNYLIYILFSLEYKYKYVYLVILKRSNCLLNMNNSYLITGGTGSFGKAFY